MKLPAILKIYPNPTSGKFTIELPSVQKVEVYNLLGKLVLENKTVENDNSIMLDLSAHPKGVYIVKASDGANLKVKKIIFQ